MSQKGAGAPRRALGRGLDALIPAPTAEGRKGDYLLCPIEKLLPRKGQPRKHFDDAALDELSQSIKEQGVIQPIVVRPAPGGFEIIAGERRWRAAQRAAMREVPVVVKDVSSARALEMALVENLQREDLNPIEKAEAYRQLIDEHELTHDELARRLGKARPTIANSLRLLALPEEVQTRLFEGELSEGHGRALLGAGDPKLVAALARRVVKGGLSVRQTERLARAAASPARGGKPRAGAAETAQVRHVEKRLRQRLGCVVRLRDSDGRGHKGVLELHYTSADELERLLDVLLGTGL